MNSPFARVVARLDSRALHANYRAIREQARGLGILAMIKANGYGHGAAWIARELMHEPDLDGFGVATFEEGQELREALGAQGKRARVVVFAGAMGWSDEKGRFCERHGLTPVIAGDEDWHAFTRGKWPARIPYELKFNTGMNRVGLSPGLARVIAKTLRDRPAVEHPAGVLSHLAMSESPGAKVSRRQRECFAAIRGELASAIPKARFHLGNSGALWNAKDWGLHDLTDIVRPGISLYGVVPWAGAPRRGLVPVMSLQAMVVAVNRLKRGASVGYGAKFVAAEEGTRVAVLAAGYGDGVHRALGDGGTVGFSERGEPGRFAGAVSMDLSSALCPASTRVGEWAEIFGARVDVWEQARAAGTIPYELLTSVAGRVQRIYG